MCNVWLLLPASQGDHHTTPAHAAPAESHAAAQQQQLMGQSHPLPPAASSRAQGWSRWSRNPGDTGIAPFRRPSPSSTAPITHNTAFPPAPTLAWAASPHLPPAARSRWRGCKTPSRRINHVFDNFQVAIGVCRSCLGRLAAAWAASRGAQMRTREGGARWRVALALVFAGETDLLSSMRRITCRAGHGRPALLRAELPSPAARG